MPPAAPASLEVEVRPPWPYRLPLRKGGDGVQRLRGGVLSRLLHVAGAPVVVHAWQPGGREVRLRAVAVDTDAIEIPESGEAGSRASARRGAGGSAGAGCARDGSERGARLELAVERMRFALGVDEDLSEFYEAFRGDPLIGPAVRRKPWLRPKHRPWPWEALAWAITEQLIESGRAAEIQRRIVRRWGPRLIPRDRHTDAPWRGPGPLRDVPAAEMIAARAPAELAAMDLSAARSLALVKCAREVAAGRADLSCSASDARLLRISEIGPWTVQCLGLLGRGDPDSLPAGDLAYVKLVGYLANLRRRATVEEVEEYFAPYAPFRGLAGCFALSHWGRAMGAGPPARAAA